MSRFYETTSEPVYVVVLLFILVFSLFSSIVTRRDCRDPLHNRDKSASPEEPSHGRIL